jgi:ATP-dependent DNA helicase RecQ
MEIKIAAIAIIASIPKRKVEAKENAVKLLKTIRALDERFPAEYVIPIVMGRLTSQNQMYRHDALDVFASGNDQPEHYWNSLVRQLLLESLLEKDITEYGVLKFTKKGEAFLKKPTSFKMILNNLYEDANEDDDEVVDNSTPVSADPVLFEMLKDLRQTVSKEKKLPPFVIFLETSLEEMATQYPITLESLEKINGVSKGKALRYGKRFVEVIAKYVEENDIVRPDDFVMKSVVNKSSNKVYIIQQVDKKIPIESIAKTRDMKLEELLEEMETIVASGTKLNLDYAINQMVDEDDQSEILEYFKSCETSSLQVAQEEMSDLSLEWDQLKIMRIKFLSVYGM